MKFLIDADVPLSVGEALKARGHDIVDARSLPGAPLSDDHLYRLIQAQQRVLITRDLDFANLLRYPPNSQCGLIVLRIHRWPSGEIPTLVEELLTRVEPTTLIGALVIAQPGRYRIHRP